MRPAFWGSVAGGGFDVADDGVFPEADGIARSAIVKVGHIEVRRHRRNAKAALIRG